MGKLEYITFHIEGEQQKVHKYRKAVENVCRHVGKESICEMRETHEHTKITPVFSLVITYRAIGLLLSLLVHTGPCGTVIYVASPHC
jgi:hypothetical protein